MICCPNCQHANPETARYCERCGVNLGDSAPKDAQGRPRYTGSARSSFPTSTSQWFARWRSALLADVRGRVLELGVRGGPNFPFYVPGTQVVATDLDARAIHGARKAFPRFAQGLALGLADAQRLPFADQSFDSVVATLVFCTIPDPALALGEVARVLRPGGRLYTIDHVRAEPPALGALMDAVAPIWKFVSGGDHLNRHTEDIFRASGFRITQRRTAWLGILLWLVMDPPE